MIEIVILFDPASIVLAFGLMYLAAAFLNRAWWHIPIVGLIVGLAVRAIFFDTGYQSQTSKHYVVQVLVATIHATLGYFSMGMPSWKSKKRAPLPPIEPVREKSLSPTIEERLSKLDELRDKNLISEAEHGAARKRLLESL